MTTSIVQTLFGFWQAWCRDYFLGKPAPVTDHPTWPLHNAQSQLHSMCLCPVTGPQRKEISTSSLLASLEAPPKLCFPSYLSPSFLTQFMTAHFTFTCKASAVQQALILPHLDRNYHPSDVAHRPPKCMLFPGWNTSSQVILTIAGDSRDWTVRSCKTCVIKVTFKQTRCKTLLIW